MHGAKLLVALMFVAIPLTGCIGGQDGESIDTASGDDMVLNTTAPEGRGTIVAFEETNQTEEGVDGIDHHHDYWSGRDRVVVFETTADMSPIADDQGRVTATFSPPQPGSADYDENNPPLVYEATQFVDFTISEPRRRACEPFFTLDGEFVCTDNLDYHVPAVPETPSADDPSGGPQGLTLRYMHASTTQWIDVGPIEWGVPARIEITNPVHTDMPHATGSVWRFQVVSPNREDATLSFNAKAEIVRGNDNVPLWPGHPLFYTPENPIRVLIREERFLACDGAGCLTSEEPGPAVPNNVVSYGTRTLHIWVNITDFTAVNPATAPNTWFLFHNNATSQQNITNPFDTENHGIETMQHYWVLPVDDNGMDSPYADGSRFAFSLGGALMTPIISCYAGCAEWSAAYTMTIHASSIEEERYNRDCLRDDYHCPANEDGSRDPY